MQTVIAVSAHLDAKGEYSGDFVVERGGDVYVRWNGQPHPSTVKQDEVVSAAAICEWQEFGALVKHVDGWRSPK